MPKQKRALRRVQKIVHGLLPQMAILWVATMGPRAMNQCIVVAGNEVAVQSVHCLRPLCAHSRMLVQVATTAVKLVVMHPVAFVYVVS